MVARTNPKVYVRALKGSPNRNFAVYMYKYHNSYMETVPETWQASQGAFKKDLLRVGSGWDVGMAVEGPA